MIDQGTVRGQALADALAACPELAVRTESRDDLWIAVWSTICTESATDVVPLGATTPVRVTSEYATDELIAAMQWLTAHEDRARGLDPLRLFVMLRGAATRGATGSARSAQADHLHGLTNVRPGTPVRWIEVDALNEAS